MPITLPPLTRRDFLQRGTAAAFGALATQLPAIDIPEQVWVLFSDTHIAADETLVARGVNMAENLRRCANQVLKIGQKPFGLIVNGDCAYLEGISEDYVSFLRCMQPLREQSIQVHCTLGNHDHRNNFLNAVIGPPPPNAERPMNVPDKHVATVTSALVNWILLDSLDLVNKTPGRLGEAQLVWLERELRNAPNKPTFIVGHHDPQGPVPEGKQPTGLLDSDALFDLLAAYPKVQGYIYGHTHNWLKTKHEKTGLPLLNLPPVAYVFNPKRPNGWVIARIDSDRAEFELRALNPAHDEHGQKHVIKFT
jgi:Icc protein